VWGAIERALDPIVAVPGKRRIIVYSEHDAGMPEGCGDLPAAALKCGASVSAVCRTPDAVLEDLCRRTHGDFRVAGAAAAVPSLVEQAHRARRPRARQPAGWLGRDPLGGAQPGSRGGRG